MSVAFEVEAGAYWELVIDATDPDDDLATIDVTFSGTSADWIQFDQESLTISTIPELAGVQTLGTSSVTIVLEDLLGNQSQWPVTIQVYCPSGSDDPLCFVEPEEDDTASGLADGGLQPIDSGATTVDTITATDSLADFTLDYEPTVVTPIEEQVAPPDPALEEDGFVDVQGVLSAE